MHKTTEISHNTFGNKAPFPSNEDRSLPDNLAVNIKTKMETAALREAIVGLF